MKDELRKKNYNKAKSDRIQDFVRRNVKKITKTNAVAVFVDELI
jgi:hypothetical protein